MKVPFAEPFLFATGEKKSCDKYEVLVKGETGRIRLVHL